MRVFLSSILFIFSFHLHAGDTLDIAAEPRIQFLPAISLLNYASLDDLYSPNIYYGRGVYGSLRMSFTPGVNRHIIEAGFSRFQRSPLYNSVPSLYYLDEERFRKIDNYEIDLGYRYLRKLRNLPSGPFTLYLSGEMFLGTNMISDTQVYPEIYYWSFSPGAALSFRAADRHHFDIAFYVPVFSVVLRNNYSTAYPQVYEKYTQKYFIRDNIMAVSLDKLRAVHAEAEYELKLTGHIGLAARYRFEYFYLNSPRPLRRVYGLYSTGLIINL